jgi:hypothetical protein
VYDTPLLYFGFQWMPAKRILSPSEAELDALVICHVTLQAKEPKLQFQPRETLGNKRTNRTLPACEAVGTRLSCFMTARRPASSFSSLDSCKPHLSKPVYNSSSTTLPTPATKSENPAKYNTVPWNATPAKRLPPRHRFHRRILSYHAASTPTTTARA